IAAPELAQDHAKANRLFGAPVGSVQAGDMQEGEELVNVIPEVLGQSLVGRVGLGREDHIFQDVLQTAGGDGQAVLADLAGRMTVAQVQALAKQLGDTAWKADRSPSSGFQNFLAASQNVLVAL